MFLVKPIAFSFFFHHGATFICLDQVAQNLTQHMEQGTHVRGWECDSFFLLTSTRQPPGSTTSAVGVDAYSSRFASSANLSTVDLDRVWASAAVAVSASSADSSMCASLTWTGVTVQSPGKDARTLLHGSRGLAPSSGLLAIAGPSGAGKSTLFKVLSGRGALPHEGSVLINGRACSRDEMVARSGFVFQDPLYPSCLTVHEVLSFCATVKLPSVLSARAREERVNLMMDLFDLRRVANTPVGGADSAGISGGEKKRLALCAEAIDMPWILFADEPLSGLDAASGLRVLQLLSALAERGTTVVITLHQPRSAMLPFIDRYHILSDGRDVFSGSLPTMMAFFSDYVDLPVPSGCNPLDFVLDVVNSDTAMSAIIGGPQFAALFADRPYVAKGIAAKSSEVAPLVKGAESRSNVAELLATRFSETGFLERDLAAEAASTTTSLGKLPAPGARASLVRRFVAILHREFLQKLRNPDIAATEVAFGILVAVIFGTIYLRFAPYNTYPRGMACNWGTLLMGLLVFHICIIFPAERPIWRRDYANGLYGSLEFYVATACAGTPGDVLGAVLFSLVFYFLTTIEVSASGFFTFMGFHVLCTTTFAALYYCAGALAPSGTVANAITSVLLVFVIALNGYFIPLYEIGWWWRWISEINFLRFVNQAVFVTQFAGQVYNCTGVSATQCTFPSGDAYLLSLGIDPSLNVGLMALYTVICWAVFHVLGFVCVHFFYKI